MRYVIAGGGAYGAHYVRKLLEAINLGKVELDEIVVVDRDAGCQVAQIAEEEPIVSLEATDWRSFADQVWANPAAWAGDIWIPAPIAPHILAEWVIDRIEHLTQKNDRPGHDAGGTPGASVRTTGSRWPDSPEPCTGALPA